MIQLSYKCYANRWTSLSSMIQRQKHFSFEWFRWFLLIPQALKVRYLGKNKNQARVKNVRFMRQSTFRNRPPKKGTLSRRSFMGGGCLRKSNHRGSLPRLRPVDSSKLRKIIYCMQFLSYDMRTLVTKRFSYIVISIHTDHSVWSISELRYAYSCY